MRCYNVLTKTYFNPDLVHNEEMKMNVHNEAIRNLNIQKLIFNII